MEHASLRGVVDSSTDAELGTKTFRFKTFADPLFCTGDAEGGDGAGVPLVGMDPDDASGRSCC